MSLSFSEAVRSGEFVVTAECVPPRSAGVNSLQACAASLSSIVDGINVPESEDGVRMSALAAASHLIGAGAEPIMHLITRDMNRIALQSTILGAASMGIRNILCTTGKHQTLTSSRSAKGVFDIDPVQLLQIADKMRKTGELADGETIDSPIDILLGTDTNPFADPVELQVMTLEKAVAAGADFVITQTVSDLETFTQWMSLVCDKGLHTRTCIIARVDTADAAKAVKAIDGVRGICILSGDDHTSVRDILTASGIARS